jgi:hypothetical protein
LPGERTGQYYEDIFESLPCPTLILDPEIRIIDFNRAAFTFLNNDPEVLNRLIGDALRCQYAVSSPGGCGTSDRCTECGLRNAVTGSIQNRKTHTGVVEMLRVTERGATPETFMISSAACRPSVDGTAEEPETVILTFQPLNLSDGGPRDDSATHGTGQRFGAGTRPKRSSKKALARS